MAYKNLAETIGKFFHKGSGIFILGHLQTGSYDDQDGKTIRTTDLVVESIEFDRKEMKKEEVEEKTDGEIIADAMKEDPYKAFGEQIEIDDSELPW